MAIEILTVSLSDESVARVAEAVAAKLGGAQQPANPTPAAPAAAPAAPVSSALPAGTPTTAAPEDPWAGTNTQPAPPIQQAQPTVPTCIHGPMRFVPGGFSKTTGKAYAAFYGCPTPRGTPNQCKSVPA